MAARRPPLRHGSLGRALPARASKLPPAAPGRAPNVMDFFRTMQREARDEGQELDALGAALHAQSRRQKKLKLQGAKGSPLAREGPLARELRGSCSLPALANAAPARPGLEEWELHATAWERFEASPPATLYVELVPWPPESDDVLDFYERIHALGDLKKAYKLACRRWHPDKFLQRYGSLVPPQEVKYMSFRLNELFQSITTQWTVLQRNQS